MASQPSDRTMHHVYLLRSLAEPKQTYIGLTDDMRARLKSHNEGANFHTAKYRPWELVCCILGSTNRRYGSNERQSPRSCFAWSPTRDESEACPA